MFGTCEIRRLNPALDFAQFSLSSIDLNDEKTKNRVDPSRKMEHFRVIMPSNAKSGKSLYHVKPEKVNKFENCNNLWKQNNFRNPMRKLKA